MKKFLLSLSLVAMAMTASAQKPLLDSKALTMPVSRVHTTNMKAVLPAGLTAKDIKPSKMSFKSPAAAPAQSDIYGKYIDDSYSDFHECFESTISDSIWTDSESGQSYELLKLNLGNGYINDVIGEYDAESGTIIIPAGQDCYEYSGYGKMCVLGWNYAEEEGYIDFDVDEETKTYNPIEFTVNDDGSIALTSCDGLCVYMYEYTDADGNVGGIWTLFYGDNLFKPNASQKYRRYMKSLYGDTSWTSVTNGAYVENYGSSISVYNFLGLGYLEFTANEDGTYNAEVGQPIYTLYSNSFSDEDYATYGHYFTVHAGQVKSDGYIYYHADEDVDVITGIADSDSLYITTGDGYGYLSLCSNADADGAVYALGLACDYVLYFDGGTAGINEISAADTKKKDARAYNVMGQQVNYATAKGLVIRDGKKYLKK